MARAEMLIRSPVNKVFEAFVDRRSRPSSGSAVAAPSSKLENWYAGIGRCTASQPKQWSRHWSRTREFSSSGPRMARPLIEHEVLLNLVADRFPDGLPK